MGALVAATCKLEGASAVLAGTVTIRVLLIVPLGGGVTLAGLKPQVVPGGPPAQLRFTALINPSTDVTVQVEVAVPPARMLSIEGLQLILKSVAATLRLKLRVNPAPVPVARTA